MSTFGSFAEPGFWLVIALVAGIIAKLIHPGKDPGGLLVTLLIGIVGAFVGGYLGHLVFGGEQLTGFDIRTLAVAVVGGVLVLTVYRFLIHKT